MKIILHCKEQTVQLAKLIIKLQSILTIVKGQAYT